MIEICRYSLDGIDYIIGAHIYNLVDIKIPSIYFAITNRSSKKNRPKKLAYKYERQYKFLKTDKIHTLVSYFLKKIEEFLKDYNYVSFIPFNEKIDKRERLYTKFIEKMGFKLNYKYNFTIDERYRILLFARVGYEIKKKYIRQIIKSLYE